jgi:galactokinase
MNVNQRCNTDKLINEHTDYAGYQALVARQSTQLGIITAKIRKTTSLRHATHKYSQMRCGHMRKT